MSDVGSWLTLFGLGAYHGINPGMGWLFAVSLGLQERSRRAVLAALPPIALGHALSISLVVAIVWLAQAYFTLKTLRIGAALTLFGFGAYRFVRSRHPNWVGMRVGFRDLTMWSFMMASAHGAGLMLVPVILGWPQESHHHSMVHSAPAALMRHAGSFPVELADALASRLSWLTVVAVHSAGHLSVAALIAILVYEKLGLALLGRAWFNLDLLWVIALMLSGGLILIW